MNEPQRREMQAFGESPRPASEARLGGASLGETWLGGEGAGAASDAPTGCDRSDPVGVGLAPPFPPRLAPPSLAAPTGVRAFTRRRLLLATGAALALGAIVG